MYNANNDIDSRLNAKKNESKILFSEESLYSFLDIRFLHDVLQGSGVGGGVYAKTNMCYLSDLNAVDIGDENISKKNELVNNLEEKLREVLLSNRNSAEMQQYNELKEDISNIMENIKKIVPERTFGPGGEIERSALNESYNNHYLHNLYVTYTLYLRRSQSLEKLMCSSQEFKSLFNKYFSNRNDPYILRINLEYPNISISEHDGRFFFEIGTGASVDKKEFERFLEKLMFRSPSLLADEKNHI
ncbi:MAG: hypothetical protein CVU81_03020 [Euryarchaeota archaeon HGW-Euryarchaeota-1]|nr:MAG: hypothetical protein CVU81_03020 [Euryarchaeota archaeon HGW-Euryarchaeota-1]